MEKYLKSVFRICEGARDICFDIIEEVNDGDYRSALVLSSMESVYSLQTLMRAYMLTYPDCFSGKFGDRVKRFVKLSPERWIKIKTHSRCFQNERNDVKYYDELPF